ncbi:hypothetical protein HDV00_004624 [Rhizophlyctis rosea]|nr:hypothetical protein HDV00_004624 [Rhizophlyctis rosea]
MEQTSVAGNDLRVAEWQGRLASLLRDQGLYDHAKGLYMDCLKTRERLLGENDPITILSAVNISLCCSLQGNEEEGEALMEQYVEVLEQLTGMEAADARARRQPSDFDLAKLHVSKGEYDRAEALYKSRVAESMRELGEDHPDTVRDVGVLAWIYAVQGKHEQAQVLYMDCAERMRRILGEDHPTTIDFVLKLADSYGEQGKHGEAEPLYADCVKRGDKHPGLLKRAYESAKACLAEEKYEKAQTFLLYCLKMRRQVTGDDDAKALKIMKELADVYNAQGKLTEAEPLYMECLERGTRVFGEDHHVTLFFRSDLGNLRCSQGRSAEADVIHEHCLVRRKQTLGDDHEHTLYSLKDLADVYYYQRRYAESEALYSECWEAQTLVGKRSRGDP